MKYVDQVKAKVLTQITDRNNAQTRLKRLRNELLEAKQRKDEIALQVATKQKAHIVHLGDGNVSRAQDMAQQLDALQQKIMRESSLIEMLDSSGIPESENALIDAERRLAIALGRHLDAARIKIEREVAAELDALIARFDAYDQDVRSILDEISFKCHDQGIFAGSRRLSPTCISEATIKHFISFFNLGLDFERWKIQLNQRLNAID